MIAFESLISCRFLIATACSATWDVNELCDSRHYSSPTQKRFLLLLLYGPRDESLVITERIENVPEEYREVGTAILMENDKGHTKTFLVGWW